MKTEKDERIKAKHVPLRQYVITFSVLTILSAGQSFVYGASIGLVVPVKNIILGLAYWAIVALVFCLITNRQIYQAYDKPMRKLGEAAKQVAKGDFSIWVEPFHKGEKKDYIDVMFEDFNKMVEELGSIETLKNEFVANVSHEIKTPLSVIQNYAMALKKENITPENREEYTDIAIPL